MWHINHKYTTTLSIILVSLLMLVGCTVAGASNDDSTFSITTTPTITSTETDIPATQSTELIAEYPDFISVIAKVRPSVVAITTEVTISGFFGGFYTQQGAGSGWIINTDGLIVTNNHVIENVSSITVTLEDGRSFPADAIYSDDVSDLAVIKINAQNLPALSIGDSSKLQVGQWVIAIGNSLGMGISATKGIVSALNISLSSNPGENLDNLIQTDAAINPGNSGGPLVNLKGELVGINSIKISQVGVEGMGYAISIEEAKPVIDQLIQNGYVIRPYLGVDLYTVDQFVILRFDLPINKGAFVTNVASGSPADKAGIAPGDVIIAINDKELSSAEELTALIHSFDIGQQIEITFYHNKTIKNVTATLTKAPNS